MDLTVCMLCLHSDAEVKHTTAWSAASGKLGHRQVSGLDSDDESLAEYIGQMSMSNRHTGDDSMTVEVSSRLRSQVNGWLHRILYILSQIGTETFTECKLSETGRFKE